MPSQELDRAHDADLQRLIDQTFDAIFRGFDDLALTLDLASNAKDRYSAAVRQELAHARDFWTAQADRFEQELQAGPLDPARLDRLGDLLPPQRAQLRFALERISPSFAQICTDFGTELRDLLIKALASMSRDDPSIALNLINHVLTRAPKFYPALMMKGALLLELGEEVQQIPSYFETAVVSPPRTESTTRYKVLALELLAESLERADNHPEALRAYRRIQKIIPPNPLFDYHTARALASHRKTSDAIASFEIVVRNQPRYYALALLEDDLSLIRDQILTSLEERSSAWIDTTGQVLDMAQSIRMVAEDYGVDDDPSIVKGFNELDEIQKEAENGSYTTLRDLREQRLIEWARTYPAGVQELLTKTIETRYDDIRKYNRGLNALVARKRQRLVRIWGVPWSGFGLLTMVGLILLKQPMFGALFMFIVWMVLGYGVLKILESRFESRVNLRKKDPGSLRMVQGEVRKIHRLRSEMLIMLEKAGDQEQAY